jgi:hypothetical protein
MNKITIFIVILVISLHSQAISGNQIYQPPMRIHDEVRTGQLDLNDRYGEDVFSCSEPTHQAYGREGIPSVDRPVFVAVSEADQFLDSSDLILGIKIGDEVRAYPHRILRHHEIVNDHLGPQHFSMTYCPLTGSGIAYQTDQLNNSELGVTGMLFESNLVFYDRTTDSCFPQMLGFGFSGPRRGQQLNYTPILETTWESWKMLYPQSQVLSLNTGYSTDRYEVNHYAQYETSRSIMSPISSVIDLEPYNLFHPKAKTLLLQYSTTHYLFAFEELSKFPVTTHLVGENRIVVLYDQINNLAIPYIAELDDGTSLNFQVFDYESVGKYSGLFFQDQLGNIWNIRGEAIFGPNLGAHLKQYPAYNAYWFAATAFFPNAMIFLGNKLIEYDIVLPEGILFSPKEQKTQELRILSLIVLPLVVIPILLKLTSKKWSTFLRL